MTRKITAYILIIASVFIALFWSIYQVSFRVCSNQILTQFVDREDSNHFHLTKNFGDIFKDKSIRLEGQMPKVIYIEPNLTYISDNFEQKEIKIIEECYNKTNLKVVEN